MNSKKMQFTQLANLALSPKAVLEAAQQTGFCIRIGKIHPCAFWETFCLESVRGTVSYYSTFSGVKNAHKAVCNARIQGVYDILEGRFLHFSMDPYTRNDLAAALDFTAQPGDLVLKDRGYFKPQAIQKTIEQGADCIFRYKHPTLFFGAETGKRLDLAELLKKNGSIDLNVLMGSDSSDQVPVRLIAFPGLHHGQAKPSLAEFLAQTRAP